VWTEWRRSTGGAVSSIDDPRWLCVFDVDLEVLDLREPATLTSLGVTAAELVAAWSPEAPNEACRRVMAAAIAAGVDAIVVPSAAHPGGWNVAVMPPAFAGLRLVSRRRRSPPP
jgi:RES domain-containing protein